MSRDGWGEEETDEQRKVNKGYARMAKLDALLSQKTKEAKELAWQREQERWLAEYGGEGEEGEGGEEGGYRNAALVKFEAAHPRDDGDGGRWARRRNTAGSSVSQQLEESMSDTADKMLQRTLGSSGGHSRAPYITTSLSGVLYL